MKKLLILVSITLVSTIFTGCVLPDRDPSLDPNDPHNGNSVDEPVVIPNPGGGSGVTPPPGGSGTPPTGTCSAVASFHGEIGNTSVPRGGGVAKEGTVPPSVDAGLEKVKTAFGDRSTFTKLTRGKGLEKDLSSSPIQVTNAVVTATYPAASKFTNNGYFFIQDKSGGYFVRVPDTMWTAATPHVGDKVSFKVTKLVIFGGAAGDKNGIQQISGLTDAAVDSSARATTNVYYKNVNTSGISGDDANTLVSFNGTAKAGNPCQFSNNKTCYTVTTADSQSITVVVPVKDDTTFSNQCVTIMAPVSAYEYDSPQVELTNPAWDSLRISNVSSGGVTPPPGGGSGTPPTGTCLAATSFHGEIGNTSAPRGGGVPMAGTVPPSVDAGLEQVKTAFGTRTNFMKKKSTLIQELTTPIKIIDAVVTATYPEIGKYKNSGFFYIQDKSGGYFVRIIDKDWDSTAVPHVGDKVSFSIKELSIYGGDTTNDQGLPQISKIDSSSIQVKKTDNASTNVYYKEVNNTGIAKEDVNQIVYAFGDLTKDSTCSVSNKKDCYILTTPDSKRIKIVVSQSTSLSLGEQCTTILAPVSYSDSPYIKLNNSAWLKAK